MRTSWEGFKGGVQICQVFGFFLKGLFEEDLVYLVSGPARSTLQGGGIVTLSELATQRGGPRNERNSPETSKGQNVDAQGAQEASK